MLGYEFYSRELAMRNECWEKDGKRDAPRTLDQSVSIVRENSYIVIVNPTASSEYNDSELEAGTDRISCYCLAYRRRDQSVCRSESARQACAGKCQTGEEIKGREDDMTYSTRQ